MQKIILALVLLLLFILSSCGNSSEKKRVEEQKELIISIKSLIGKNKIEIEKILGKAERTEKVKPSRTPCLESPCDKSYYESDKFEIVFINNKADWITINKVSNIDNAKDNIILLGLAESEPSYQGTDNTLRWKNIENIKEITFFDNGSGKIDYIYIKAETE